MHTLTHPHAGRTVQVPEQDAPRWLAVGWLDTAADAVEELFAETDDGENPELETARALVQRQYAAKLAAGKRDQVAAALARRGFSHAVIREVLSDDE